jgi:hypothetical protein
MFLPDNAKWHWTVFVLTSLFAVSYAATSQARQGDAIADSKNLETVTGEGCYAYGDNETPAQAKRAAQIIAQETAVRSHRVFVQSNTKLKNFQVEEDVIQTASAAMLQNVKIEKEWKKGQQEVCVAISAKISPISAEELIKQRINAKDIAQEAANTKVLPSAPGFGLRLWTNKPDGRFLEGERLIVSVSPARDGYLKLDYFQADGTVVHLVPNLFRGQAFVKAGQTYTFGDDASPEHFVIQGPYGDEAVKAILSARPIEIPMESGQPVDNSRDYLKNLKSGTRGIGVVGVEKSASLVTLSKTVSEYQQTKK